MRFLKSTFLSIAMMLTGIVNAIAGGPDHWSTRAYVEYDQSFIVGTGQVLIIGDSITEMFWWNIFGNHFILNAGQGGAGIDQAIVNANGIAPVALPHVSLVMIGINDCQMPTPTTDYAAWGVKYAQLLASLKASSTKVLAVSILPVDPTGSLAPNFSTTCQMNLNSQVVAKAAAAAVPLVNANYVFGNPATGYSTMLPGNSIDGVHLNSVGQTKMFNMYQSAVMSNW